MFIFRTRFGVQTLIPELFGKIILSVICSCWIKYLTQLFNYRNIRYSLVKELYPLTVTGDQLPVTEKLYLTVKSKNGDDEIRTHDPRLARAVLSQLSYVPVSIVN